MAIFRLMRLVLAILFLRWCGGIGAEEDIRRCPSAARHHTRRRRTRIPRRRERGGRIECCGGSSSTIVCLLFSCARIVYHIVLFARVDGEGHAWEGERLETRIHRGAHRACCGPVVFLFVGSRRGVAHRTRCATGEECGDAFPICPPQVLLLRHASA